MDDRIYVIYFDGKRYVKRGLKIAYLTEGAAKQVITVEAKTLHNMNTKVIDGT